MRARGIGGARTGRRVWLPRDLGTKLTGLWTTDQGITQATGTCSAWADRVAARTWGQATGANRPAVVASIFGGQSALRFDGLAKFMATSVALGTFVTTTLGSIYVVYRPIAISRTSGSAFTDDGIISGAGGQLTLSANGGGGGRIQAGLFDGGFKQTETTGTVAVTAGTPVVATWRHKAGKVGVRKGQSAFVELTAGALTDVSGIAHMGAGYNDTFFGNCDIGAVVMVNADLSVTEDARLLRWLAGWGGGIAL